MLHVLLPVVDGVWVGRDATLEDRLAATRLRNATIRHRHFRRNCQQHRQLYTRSSADAEIARTDALIIAAKCKTPHFSTPYMYSGLPRQNSQPH